MSKPIKRPAGRPRIIFTPEMDAALKRLRPTLRPEHLAERIGVSTAPMYRRMRELNLPVRTCNRSRRVSV